MGSMKAAMASRANGQLGGRPKDTRALRAAKRIRDRALALGRSQTLANLRFWLQIRDDVTKPIALRMQAAQEIEDRYGIPRQTSSVNIHAEMSQEPVKLFELVGAFEPPATWNEHPPEKSEAVVLDEGAEA